MGIEKVEHIFEELTPRKCETYTVPVGEDSHPGHQRFLWQEQLETLPLLFIMCVMYHADMEIIFWNEKVDAFINGLDRITSSRVRKTIKALEKFGHLLGMPDSKSLGKGLFELRTLGKNQIRILYVFHNNKAYIVHGFIKKAWKISLRDISYAKQIQQEVMRLA